MAGQQALPELIERLDRCLGHFGATKVSDITEVYDYYPDFRRAKLGSGSYGETFMMKSRSHPEDPERAVKIIPKARITRTPLQIQHICAEIAVTTKLRNPHLNQATGIYHSPTHLFFVLEMCVGPTPDIRTRLYHLFARYHPPRIPEVEALAATYEEELRRLEAEAGKPIPPLDKAAFFDGKMRGVCEQLGVKGEAPTRTDLFNLIVQMKKVPDAKAAVIMKQCLQGLDFMHMNQVVHRDIKTENVILGETRTSEAIRDASGAVVGVRIKEKIQVKLIDFGLVKYTKLGSFPLSPSPGTFETAMDPFATGNPSAPPAPYNPGQQAELVAVTPCGTELYCALEVLTGILDSSGQGATKWTSTSDQLPKLDVYGAGTMMFCMANGRAPFRLANTSYRPVSRTEKLRQIQQLISAGPLFSSSVSESQKQMIMKLMTNDAHARPTAAAALQDPYFANVGATYVYEVNKEGQVSVVSAADDEEAATALKDDDIMEIMRGKEDDGDGVGKTQQPNE